MITSVGSSRYRAWRASDLGRITDALEYRLLVELAGPLAGRHVLDVGCGDGAFAARLADAGADVRGIDADPAMIDAARLAVPDGRFVVGDAQRLPYPDGCFDCVTALTLLCLVEDPAAAVAEMARVTAPGGRILLGELGRWSLWALWRRLRGRFGSQLWRSASFWTPADLARLARGLPLRVERCDGAVYYPPLDGAAHLLAPFDRALSRRLGALGAAFVAMRLRRT